jgi:tripartite-type tricarboxylate transporter receptor subunit TctC
MKRIFFAIVCCMYSLGVQAQDWPRKPITLIIPNLIGGAYDAAARPLGDRLSTVFGQPFVIDNRPAGQGVAGIVAAKNASPDGHTLLFTGQGQISFLPALRKEVPYDTFKDLAPIVRIGSLESFVLVSPSVPAKNIAELFALAKAKPDTITVGTWGSSSTSNLYIEYFRKAKGIPFFAVPDKGAAQAYQAGVSGEVMVTIFAQGTAAPQVKAGKFRVLAVTGRKRSAAYPELPTLREAGFDLDMSTWIGMFAPAATSRTIVNRVSAEVNKLLVDPSFADKVLVAVGFQPEEPNKPEEFAAFLKKDRQVYTDLIRITGIKDE